MERETGNAKSVSSTLLSVVFWSSSFSGIKTALESYAPAQIMVSRFLIASFLLIILAVITRIRLPYTRANLEARKIRDATCVIENLQPCTPSGV